METNPSKTQAARWIWLIGIIVILLACFSVHPSDQAALRKNSVIDGLTLVAPPQPFTKNPMVAVQEVGANWIAVIPYGFTRKNNPTVHFNSQRQWWGERPAGVMKTIELAQNADVKILLKPQVWSPGWWTGDYDFDSDQDWENWEEDYLKYINHFAELADSFKVDLFCIGTEFKNSVKERPNFWLEVIRQVRQVYKGQITYAANWDNFENIPFWQELDLIGINAYFPLLDEKTPSFKALCKAWQPHLKKIRSFHKTVKKPIVFTEYGYLSVDGCAFETWVLESRINQLEINEMAQANAIEALHHTFSQEHYWLGGFLWKWFPNMKGHEGYPAKDYTPQGKIAHQVLSEIFNGHTDP